MALFECGQNGSLDQLLSSIPSEILFEILVHLPFGELLNILILNREFNNLLIHSEYFFEKLCKITCKLNNIDQSDYGRAIESVRNENNFKNFYHSLLIKLINDYGYKWDTQFQYFEKENQYELTPTTLKTFAKPSFGHFYTVKSSRLLNPGNFYKWKIKLDSYNPKAVGNSFKIMIGIESLNFFPFNKQRDADVIGWQDKSKGIALIIGKGEIIQASCSYKYPNQKVNKSFLTDDIIQIEFDFRNIPNYRPVECPQQYQYSNIEDDTNYMGLVRFSLIRDDKLEVFKSWIPFGDARFAPYVPAVSVNLGQTISFV